MNDHKQYLFYSGLSGLQLPVPKYLFPQQYQSGSRLTYYATFFNSIEINSSFYKLPQANTVAKWTSSVPENFVFTFKLWKQITHIKHLNFDRIDVIKFFNSVSNAGNKKGSILIQFPPSLGKENMVQLDFLLRCIAECDMDRAWKIAVEFRNNSWYHEDVYKLLEDYKAAIVIQDIPKSATPMTTQNLDFVYVRFHGPTGNYQESYSEGFLSEYASYINEWLVQGKSVFVYFNNTMGDAFKNLEMLNQFVFTQRKE